MPLRMPIGRSARIGSHGLSVESVVRLLLFVALQRPGELVFQPSELTCHSVRSPGSGATTTTPCVIRRVAAFGQRSR